MPKAGGRKIKWMNLLRPFGVILFIILLFKIDLHEVWANLKLVDPLYLILAFLFQAILLLIKGIRWHILRGGKIIPAKLLFDMGAFLESYAIGVVTPGRLGELTKAGHEQNKGAKWLSVFKIIAERGFDLGIFIFVAGLAVIRYDMLLIGSVWGYFIATGGFIFILLSYVLLSGKQIKFYLAKKIFKTGRINRFLNFEFNLRLGQINNIFSLSTLGNAATFISCYFLALGISMGSNFLFTSGGVAVTGLLNLLPITVMGLGTREVSFLYLFQQFDKSLVMAFSFLMFITLQVGGGILALIFGQIFIFADKNRKRS